MVASSGSTSLYRSRLHSVVININLWVVYVGLCIGTARSDRLFVSSGLPGAVSALRRGEASVHGPRVDELETLALTVREQPHVLVLKLEALSGGGLRLGRHFGGVRPARRATREC